MIRIIPNINMLIKSVQKINYSEVALNNLVKYFVKEKNERDEIINFHNEINLSNIFFSYDD